MEFTDHQHLAAAMLSRALKAHEQWKLKLQTAVEDGSPLDVALLSRDDCCELGKWLNSEGRYSYGGKPEFVNLVDKHTEFHHVAGTVAGIINSNGAQNLGSLLQSGSQYSFASTDVRFAIMQLQRRVMVESSG